MKLKNMVNVKYNKLLPDGQTALIERQSNTTFTTLLPKSTPFKTINTYYQNYQPEYPQNSTINPLLILLIITYLNN